MSLSSDSVDSSSFLAPSHLCSAASRSSEGEYKRHHDEEPKVHRYTHEHTPSSWSFSRSSWVTLRLYSSSCVSCSEDLLFRSLTLSSRSSSAFLDCSHSDRDWLTLSFYMHVLMEARMVYHNHAPYSIMLLGISGISHQSTYKILLLSSISTVHGNGTEFNFSFKNPCACSNVCSCNYKH